MDFLHNRTNNITQKIVCLIMCNGDGTKVDPKLNRFIIVLRKNQTQKLYKSKKPTSNWTWDFIKTLKVSKSRSKVPFKIKKWTSLISTHNPCLGFCQCLPHQTSNDNYSTILIHKHENMDCIKWKIIWIVTT